ncbi:hypothetical protein L2E82_06485 [Cichorium intybus]|uniref:Uncharacterized protein n=1 Tax=Cichorium intybus TaxID=13427 RepID=A0ACB9HAM0_CICIN|nr:hypothetical protein L2E82_06485 [Cichorium intybus]
MGPPLLLVISPNTSSDSLASFVAENLPIFSTTVIHELTQGIEMAKQLRLNLDSAEAREFLIQKILSSYEKALFVLQSGGQPRAGPLPGSSPPESLSSTSTGSQQSTEFEFDQFGQKDISGAILPSSFYFPSTPSGFSDDFHPLYFPNHLDDELLQGYSPLFISPATSESNDFTDWASSLDLDPNFKFNDSFF